MALHCVSALGWHPEIEMRRHRVITCLMYHNFALYFGWDYTLNGWHEGGALEAFEAWHIWW